MPLALVGMVGGLFIAFSIIMWLEQYRKRSIVAGAIALAVFVWVSCAIFSAESSKTVITHDLVGGGKIRITRFDSIVYGIQLPFREHQRIEFVK